MNGPKTRSHTGLATKTQLIRLGVSNKKRLTFLRQESKTWKVGKHSMNEGDYVNQAAEHFRDAALAEAKRRNQKYYYTGLCWNCSDALSEGSFCPGGECRDDYEKREAFRR